MANTIMEKTTDTFHKEGTQSNSLLKKLDVYRELYGSMLTESWVERKYMVRKIQVLRCLYQYILEYFMFPLSISFSVHTAKSTNICLNYICVIVLD